MPAKNGKSFNVLLDTETREQLDALVRMSKVSRGAVIRAAIQYHYRKTFGAGAASRPVTGGRMPEPLPDAQPIGPLTQ